MKIKYTIERFLELVNPLNIQGTTDQEYLTGINSLRNAKAGDLSFLSNPKYKHEVFNSKASFILLPEDYIGTPHANQVYVFVENPSLSLNNICQDISQRREHVSVPGIHPSSFVDPKAHVDPSASIGPLCVIEENAKIGQNVVLRSHVFVGKSVVIGQNTKVMPNCSILYGSQIGKNVYIDSGVTIGSEGFGYESVNNSNQKLAQIGNVVIEDNVDVGANSAIDRARFGETRIGEGTKIDNLVQIGHNVVIGKHAIICGMAGIAGSATLGDYTIVCGQAGIAGHLKIGNYSIIGAQAGVNGDLKDNSFVRGTPALPYMRANKTEVLKNQLPEIVKRLSDLESKFKVVCDEDLHSSADM